jgi:hypothetical protein
MSLCRSLHNSRADTDVMCTPANVRSATQTSSAVRRRRNSNDFTIDYSLDDDLVISRPTDTLPITPGARKRLKMSCEVIADRHGIDKEELQPFTEVCCFFP